MITVTTPNGNIGKNVVSGLISSGMAVRAFSYQPEKLPAEVREKCEVMTGSLDDPDTLKTAFAGAESIFWCVPQSHRWESASEYYGPFTAAACAALKSVHPSLPRLVGVAGGGYGVQDDGILAALGDMEDRLNATGVPTRLLRCGYFMENLFWSVETVKAAGAIFLPIAADIPLPMVAAKDIASVAVRWFGDPNWTDQQSPAVYGPARITLEEMAQILSDMLKMPIRYVEVSDDKMKETLRQYGAGEGFAEAYVRRCQAFSEGSYDREPRTTETVTPTTLHEWTLQNLAPAFRS